MRPLEETSLSEQERRVLERLIALLRDEYGPRLRSVWLFGSRARGEPPGLESDVDVLVVLDGAGAEEHFQVTHLLHQAAQIEQANPILFGVKTYAKDRVEQRREIRSFFMQEVDRDKVVLAGEA